VIVTNETAKMAQKITRHAFSTCAKTKTRYNYQPLNFDSSAHFKHANN